MHPNNGSNWYVLYTRPRFEKKIKKRFEQLEIEHCLPTYFSIRKWKDRKKKVEMLYFPNYIFVKMKEIKLWEALAVDGVVQLVKQGGRPAVIPQKDIDVLLRLRLGTEEPEIVNTSDFDEGQEVIITNGPLKDLTGRIFKVKSKLKIGLKVEGIDKSVLIEISSQDIEPVPTQAMTEVVDY